MNNDGNVKIPHGPQADETPNEAPDFSSKDNRKDVDKTTPVESNSETEISHEEPIEPTNANAAPETADTEPVDIFATKEEQAESDKQTETSASTSHIGNNPFGNRNHYQGKAPKSNVPQFFSDAVVASTPINQPKGKNKLLLIGAGIGVIIVAAILVFTVIVPSVSNSMLKQKISTNNREIRKVFNQYAHFILDGTDSEDNIEEYDQSKEYNITKIYRQEDPSALTNFYRTANEKFTKVKDKINELYPERTEYSTKIADYASDFELSYSHAIYGDYSEEILIRKFLQSNRDSALSDVENFYKKYATENYSSTYIGDAINYYESIINIIAFYKDNKCSSEDDILTGICYKKYENSTPLQSLITDKNDFYDQKRNVMMIANEKVCTQLWSIYEQIKE
ncbi:hypothetical protein J5500_02645 [Candidatus Saccharibacteria bacterium]|nr:hypothetical protein [Candidatus Saccharibacteria bacterium]